MWMPECRDDYGTITNIDPETLHDTLEAHPDVKVVLSEVQYGHQSWAVPMLRSLPNLHVEISRMINTDEVSRVVGLIGEERVLFGSPFPDAAISPQLYWLHRCGFSESTLKAICSENLERAARTRLRVADRADLRDQFTHLGRLGSGPARHHFDDHGFEQLRTRPLLGRYLLHVVLNCLCSSSVDSDCHDLSDEAGWHRTSMDSRTLSDLLGGAQCSM